MHEVKLPQLGQSVEEASIVTWYKAEGDAVKEGDPLYSVQTDKAEIECESPATGILRKIVVEPDAVVPVLSVVAFIGDEDEPIPEFETAPPETPAATPEAPAPSPVTPAPARVSEVAVLDRPAASPRASATAATLGVALAGITGTGPGGRIIEADVLAAAKRGNGRQPPAVKPATDIPGRMEPLSPMRRTVAERMTASKFAAPHFYVTVHADMSRCKALREQASGFRPTYNDFVLAACVEALHQFPAVNAQYNDEGVYLFEPINLGFAVALDAGLIVPVIKDAGAMSLQALHEAAAALVEKARTNKLRPDDYAGATFTVSNLGPYGVDEFTAIINPPGSAILAVGQMLDRPVVVDDGVQIRPMLGMTLSSDHRVIDGALAAQFAGAVKASLEAAAFRE